VDESRHGGSVQGVMVWLLVGLLAMFFIERFFCYHHHDVPDSGDTAGAHDHGHAEHAHDLTWSGAAIGLSLHSILAGVALAASVQVEWHDEGAIRLAGVGTFLVIFLHKPLDSLTLGTLMARGDWSNSARHAVNVLFALAIPLGAILFHLGIGSDDLHTSPALAYALAFSAGAFLCIALSDLLPELHFHQHDRVKLSIALVAGLSVAQVTGMFEAGEHLDDEPQAGVMASESYDDGID
jgi:zinc and cadmium transporter